MLAKNDTNVLDEELLLNIPRCLTATTGGYVSFAYCLLYFYYAQSRFLHDVPHFINEILSGMVICMQRYVTVKQPYA